MQGSPTCGMRKSFKEVPGGKRVASIFSQKPGVTAFLQLAIPIVSQHYDFRCAASKFTPRTEQFVEGKQKQKSHQIQLWSFIVILI